MLGNWYERAPISPKQKAIDIQCALILLHFQFAILAERTAVIVSSPPVFAHIHDRSTRVSVQDILRPYVQQLVVELLSVLRETENEDLTGVLQKLVCSYITEITPLAINITNHLAETFAKVLNGETDGGDEKAIAAMGILNTLETLVTVMEEQPEVGC